MGYLDRPPEDGELDSTSQCLFYILTQEETNDLDCADDTQELESSSIERGVTDFNKELIASTIAPGNCWINPFLKVPISMTPIEYQMDIWDQLAPKHGYFGLFVHPKIREDSCPVVHFNLVLGDLRHPVSKIWDLHVKFDRPNGWFLSPVPYGIPILPRYSGLGIQPLSIVFGRDGALSYLLDKHTTARDTRTIYAFLVEKIFASQRLFVLWLECCVCDARD